MHTSPEPARPHVYICSAEVNKQEVERVLEDLEHHRISRFYPHTDLLPGDPIIEQVEKHLGSSDYFLLVWSRACVGHAAVGDEWAAYVTKLRDTVQQKQGFMFVMRLDNSELPAQLEIRKQLNAFEDWDAAVTELLECCSRDRALELPVLPAPKPTAHDGRPTIMLYIRNRSLGVYHVMAVPKNSTGASLMATIHHQLDLPDHSTTPEPLRLRMEFEYQPFLNEIPIPRDSHVEVGLTDNTVVDLQVKVYDSVNDDRTLLGEYRPIPRTTLSPTTRDRLLRKAFGHLLPHDR